MSSYRVDLDAVLVQLQRAHQLRLERLHVALDPPDYRLVEVAAALAVKVDGEVVGAGAGYQIWDFGGWGEVRGCEGGMLVDGSR